MSPFLANPWLFQFLKNRVHFIKGKYLLTIVTLINNNYVVSRLPEEELAAILQWFKPQVRQKKTVSSNLETIKKILQKTAHK